MSHEVFETAINNIFFWIIWFFELVGALVIIFGALVCIIKYVQSLIKNKKVPSLKMLLANQLALGLEFMLAAEILKTVITTNRTTNEMVMLAAIVLLRAALSVLIHWELKNEEKRSEVHEKNVRRLANKTSDNA